MFRVIIPQLQMSVANVYFSWQSRAHPRLSRRKKRKLCLRYPRPPKWVPFPQQLWKKKLPGCGQLGSGRKSHYRRCWSSPKKANLGEPARSVISPHLPTVEASPAMIFLPASSSRMLHENRRKKAELTTDPRKQSIDWAWNITKFTHRWIWALLRSGHLEGRPFRQIFIDLDQRFGDLFSF